MQSLTLHSALNCAGYVTFCQESQYQVSMKENQYFKWKYLLNVIRCNIKTNCVHFGYITSYR